MVTTAVYAEVKRLYTSLQEMMGLRRRKRELQISEPFNFKREPTILPGLSEDEISVLREKAAASRLGIAPTDENLITSSSTTPILPRPSRPSSRHHHAVGAGPLSLSPPTSTPTPLPRLSIPMPIPIPVSNNNSRHGSSSASSFGGLSLRSSSTAVTRGQGQQQGGFPSLGLGCEKMSVSMNDLDLLLFGNPSGVGGGGGGGGGDINTPTNIIAAPVSPLEMDTPHAPTAAAAAVVSSFGAGSGADWWDSGMEFEFQLGSPVSPLSPASVSAPKEGLVGF